MRGEEGGETVIGDINITSIGSVVFDQIDEVLECRKSDIFDDL